MSKLSHRRISTLLLTTLVTMLVLGASVMPRVVSAVQPDPVIAAWERARASGAYHFSSDVVQVTLPTNTVTNVGRRSRTDEFHMAGDSDLTASALEFQIWASEGSVLQEKSGIAVRALDGKTYTREPGGEWQEGDSFTEALAPQGDFMAYLAATRNITAHEPETRGPAGRGITFTRYSFEIDGPAFAIFARDQMEQALRAKGELPPQMHLDVHPYYRDMTGEGELWVGENGLPLRQILTLRFPEQNDATVNARITVDFSRFGRMRFNGEEFVQVDPGQPGTIASTWPSIAGQLPDAGPMLAMLPMLALATLVVYYRRRRTLQTAVALAVIVSLVVGPALSTLQVVSFLDAQTARAAEQRATQEESELASDLRELEAMPDFNPHEDPLAAAERHTLSEAHLMANRSATLAAPAAAANLLLQDDGTDTDGDGLTDFVEQRIGTNPESADSDQDFLPDAMEVNGFQHAGQTWYTDPLELDSNGDTIPDGLEWAVNTPSAPDRDSDGVPDPFDDDNDGDGVPDRRDMAPFVVHNTIYNDSTPFQLTINGLEADRPTFVDFQLRPTDPENLWFAFHVLDWPEDREGQIIDIDRSTFADVAAAAGRTPAANEEFGDMKLIPMLELRIQGETTNLPPPEDLAPYGIIANDLSAEGSGKIAYVPLTVQTDEQTGERVAFTGRMPYLPTGSWPTPHEARLVWTIQTLLDLPCDPDAADAASIGCAADGYIHNSPTGGPHL